MKETEIAKAINEPKRSSLTDAEVEVIMARLQRIGITIDSEAHFELTDKEGDFKAFMGQLYAMLEKLSALYHILAE